MSFYNFCLLSDTEQLRHVLTHGIYLAQRQGTEGGVNLYHLADGGRGYFAEIGADATDECYMVQRSFVASGPLAEYAHGVRLPEL